MSLSVSLILLTFVTQWQPKLFFLIKQEQQSLIKNLMIVLVAIFLQIEISASITPP